MKAGEDYVGVGCGALILNDKNEVLLLKRSKNARTEPGMWSRPGGQVEFGEETEDALVREVKEETNINIKVVRQLEFTENITENNKKHWIALGYLAEHISGKPNNNEPDKHDDLKWFPIDNLPENISSYTRNSVEIFLKKKK